jgi:hypothetical protein
MSREELGGASERRDSKLPLGLAEDSRVSRNLTRSLTLRTSIWATSCKKCQMEHSIVRSIYDRNVDHRAKPKGG